MSFRRKVLLGFGVAVVAIVAGVVLFVVYMEFFWLDHRRLAANKGDPLAQFDLGLAYAQGAFGARRDPQAAADWYRKAAEQGDAKSQNNLAVLLETGNGLPQDLSEALKWYRRAADQGNPSAQYGLGRMLYKGAGVPKDLREAADWYEKAAVAGIREAQFNLGLMYYKGEGVNQDRQESIKWMRMAAQQGDKRAQENLAAIGESIK